MDVKPKLFGQPASTEVARVLACLAGKGLECRFLHIDDFGGRQKLPTLSMLKNRRGEVVFDDGKVTLINSREICRYICDTYPKSGRRLYGTDIPVFTDDDGFLPFTPPDVSNGDKGAKTEQKKNKDEETYIVEKDLIESWLLIEEYYFDPPASELVFYLAFAPLLSINTENSDLVQKAEKRFSDVLDLYDKRLENSKFLAGEYFTLADLFHLPNLNYLFNMTGRRDIFYKKKNVERWVNNVLVDPCWRKVAEEQHLKTPSRGVDIEDGELLL